MVQSIQAVCSAGHFLKSSLFIKGRILLVVKSRTEIGVAVVGKEMTRVSSAEE